MPPGAGFWKDGREQALHDYIMSLPEDQLRNKPQAILDAMHHYISTKSRMMTFQPSKFAIARKILSEQDKKPKILVELGCYVGFSAVAWGALIKEFNADDLTGCHVYTCELEPAFAKITRDFLALGGLSDIVTVVEGTSSDSIKKLKNDGSIDHIDVLFLDHWESFYLPDLVICEDEGLLRPGSVVLADNTDMPGAPDYLKYVKKGGRGAEGGLKIETKTYYTDDEGNKPKAVEVTKILGN